MVTQDEIDFWDSPVGVYLGHGTYVGPGYSNVAVVNDEEVKRCTPLKGKTAIAATTDGELIALQFDDRSLREAYGWWAVPASHFLFDLDLDE